MKADRTLDLLWKAVVLALLCFCAVRLQTLQSEAPAGPVVPAANPLVGSPEQLLKEQKERHELLSATKEAAAGGHRTLAQQHRH